MQVFEAFIIAIQSIVSHKLRSSLTLLGVVIGVMTIISTMAIIKGLQDLLEEQMSELAAGVYQVQRYDANVNFGGHHRHEFRPKITMREVRAIEQNVPEALVVAPEVWDWGNVIKYKQEATPPNVTVCGGTPGTAINNGWTVEFGRYVNDPDIQYARDVVILGANVVDRLFPYINPLGQYVTIDGHRARVVGIFKERGNIFNNNADNMCSIPISTFSQWYGNQRSWNITVQAKDPSRINKAIEQTWAAVRAVRGLKPGEENNFDIWHSNQFVESFNKMTAGIRYAAFGIASIALLVAGIGIMNIMLVTVTERTREIGIRKALGAKKRSILSQFLIEAVFLTEIGAVIGVVVGLGTIFILKSAANMTVAVPVGTIILAIIFCSVIGLVFGTWPAWKAARLDPIIALRYE